MSSCSSSVFFRFLLVLGACRAPTRAVLDMDAATGRLCPSLCVRRSSFPLTPPTFPHSFSIANDDNFRMSRKEVEGVAMSVKKPGQTNVDFATLSYGGTGVIPPGKKRGLRGGKGRWDSWG